MDEIRQTSYYSHSLSDIINLAASQQQPPLDYFIGHFVKKFSSSDFSFRLPAAFFGSFSIGVLYLLACRISVWPIAFGTAIVACLMPFNLYFSQEARPYAIAVFFLLSLLLALDNLLDISRKPILHGIVFFAAALAFLLSRTLSPLATFTVLFLILCGHFLYVKTKPHSGGDVLQFRLAAAIGVMLLALMFYLPVLRIILSLKGNYVHGSPTLGRMFDNLGLYFDLSPIWRAFVVQTDPITISLFSLMLVVPVMIFWPPISHPGRLWKYLVVLLPGTGFLNIVIFQAQTSMPFRPPYAMYILPLAFILAAGSIQFLWDLCGRSSSLKTLLRALMLAFFLLVITETVQGTMNYKFRSQKTDWRGLGEYLSGFDTSQYLFFHNTALYGYASIKHYYNGIAPFTDLSRIVAFDGNKFLNPAAEPVVVFFQAKPYYLTDNSRYPIMQGTRQLISDEGVEQIVKRQALSLTRLNNLIIMQVRNPSGSLAMDTLYLLDNALPFMEKQAELYDCYMVQGILARLAGRDDWQISLAMAESLAPSSMVNNIRQVGNTLATYPEQGAGDNNPIEQNTGIKQ